MSGTWSTDTIEGKETDVFVPEGRPAFGLLFLHDTDQRTLGDSPRLSALLSERKLACVCPRGGLSWWLDRPNAEFDPKISAERHLLERVLPFFAERWNLRPRAIGLLGFGMGGQGALRLAFRHPDRFPVVAAISPAIEFQELYHEGTPLDDMYESKEQARQDTALMHVQPFHYPPHIFFCIDPYDTRWHRGNDRLHEKLNALGVPHTCDLTTEAGGHTWDYFEHMAEPALRFLHQGLLAESRRLL